MLLRICLCAIVAVLGTGQIERREVSLLVTNATVVTMDAGRRVVAAGAVAVDGRNIVGVGSAAELAARFTAAETIDVQAAVVLPGLVNTHTHAPMVLYRGLADDLALMEWLQKYIFPAEAKTVTPEFVRAGTRLAALEMIGSGTTTYADMYYFEEEIAGATRDAGLRAVLGQTIIRFPVADAKTPAEGLARGLRFVEAFRNDPLITPALAPHALYTLDAATLRGIREAAERARAPLLIHLAETRDEVAMARKEHRATPVQYLETLGFWGGGPGRAAVPVIAAHAVHVTPADVSILAKRGVGVAHNPESNMKLASGTAPVPALRAARVPVGLGTDGAASNNDLDMFEAMRQAALLHKLASGDPRTLPAAEALAMATIEGARALGLGDVIGSLEVGKRADLIAVSMSSARQTPLYDPVSHLVYATSGSDVRTVVVDGKVLMRDRKMLTLDEQAVIVEANVQARRVREAVQR